MEHYDSETGEDILMTKVTEQVYDLDRETLLKQAVNCGAVFEQDDNGRDIEWPDEELRMMVIEEWYETIRYE